MLLFSYVLIPYIIVWISSFDDYKTKSEEQVAIMNRYYLFILLNVLLMQLIKGTQSIPDLIDEMVITVQKPLDIPEYLSNGLRKTYHQFITYYIGLIFLTQGLALLDIFHVMSRCLSKCLHSRSKSDRSK